MGRPKQDGLKSKVGQKEK